jgi:hypothetical protein
MSAPRAAQSRGDGVSERWPRVLRAGGLVERVCPHGVGHPDPDPDSVARLAESTGGAHHGVHGCDGCCATLER